VDALYKQGTASADIESAHAKFAEAVKLIDQDVPTVPVYFSNQQSGTSDKVKNVETSNVGEIDLSSVEIA
jgi:oligopeptide transport system substrate-binding protein